MSGITCIIGTMIILRKIACSDAADSCITNVSTGLAVTMDIVGLVVHALDFLTNGATRNMMVNQLVVRSSAIATDAGIAMEHAP